jgi:hypothetical protein
MINNNSFGIWTVGDKFFNNKRNALIYASNNGSPDVKWNWHNDVWKLFDINKLGKQSLKDLYKERAQQLRDTYDYLILSYSGGADSHNILMTFLNNNIKLDQIFVQKPFSFINSSYHVPNTINTEAKNHNSEWDYCVKPTLEYLSKNHPEIKIELSDWMNNITESYFVKEDSFLNAGGNKGMGSIARNLNFSKIGLLNFDKDKTVATIFGCDKPILSVNWTTSKATMIFTDIQMSHCTNSVGTFEPFYWSPMLPDLIYEMSYQVLLYYKANPHLQKFMWCKENSNNSSRTDNIISTINHDIAKIVCYSDTWDFRKFQSGKANGLREDRDFFLHEYDDFKRIKDTWKNHYDGFYQDIDKKYFDDFGNVKLISSNYYYVGDV